MRSHDPLATVRRSLLPAHAALSRMGDGGGNVTEYISWTINTLVILGWIVNIKFRPQAMIVFTITTILSMWYFYNTKQWPFALRNTAFLFIDIATLYQCRKDILKWIGAATEAITP